MAKIKNRVFLHNGYVEIVVEKAEVYRHVVLLDVEDLHRVGEIRISNTGYAYTRSRSQSVAHIVMDHKSNLKTVVDHINGNTLDNRKFNLRIVSQLENSHNKHSFIRNNTGKIGISYRENGNYRYYRVSVTDRRLKDKRGNGKRYTKQFNINKLGKQKAFLLATEWLNKKKKEFNYKN